MTEAQIYSLALSKQASQERDAKHREAIYNDVSIRQQMVSLFLHFCRLLQAPYLEISGQVRPIAI